MKISPGTRVLVLAVAVLLVVMAFSVQAGSGEGTGSFPKRIISIAPSNTEILYALGLGEKIVGVTTACDYPPDAKKKDKVGDVNLNYEKIVALSPDVVFAVDSLQKTAIDKLKQLGIRVVAVNPTNIDGVFDAIELMGKTCGVSPQKINEVVGALKERKDRAVRLARQKLGSSQVRVFVEIWNEPLMTAGPGTFIDEVIMLAGGRNVASDAQNPWPQFSDELVVQRDPEVIVLTCHNLDEVMARKTWKNISAIRSRRVYEINPDLLVRPGPRLVDGLEEMVRFITDRRGGGR